MFVLILSLAFSHVLKPNTNHKRASSAGSYRHVQIRAQNSTVKKNMTRVFPISQNISANHVNIAKSTVDTLARCGLNWKDANSKCGHPCDRLDSACIPNEKCFVNVVVSPCAIYNATNRPRKKDAKKPGISPRCGLTWPDANLKCGTNCNTDLDCPLNENCYEKLEMPCKGSKRVADKLNSTVFGNLDFSNNRMRCGKDFKYANFMCRKPCQKDADCWHTGEVCYGNLDLRPCVRSHKYWSDFTQVPIFTCGKTWEDAKVSFCRNDSNVGQRCFDDGTCNYLDQSCFYVDLKACSKNNTQQ